MKIMGISIISDANNDSENVDDYTTDIAYLAEYRGVEYDVYLIARNMSQYCI